MGRDESRGRERGLGLASQRQPDMSARLELLSQPWRQLSLSFTSSDSSSSQLGLREDEMDLIGRRRRRWRLSGARSLQSPPIQKGQHLSLQKERRLACLGALQTQVVGLGLGEQLFRTGASLNRR